MASGSFNLTRTGSTSSYITFKCSWNAKSNGSVANTSTVTVTITASKSSSSNSDTWGNQSTTVSVGSTSQSISGSFTLSPGKTITLFSKSYTVAHNDDGSKKVTISVNVGGNVMYGNGSTTAILDTIPRYAIVSQSIKTRTETTATINWSANATVDYIWYSTNDGSSWTGIDITESTNGSYNINNLTADTTYKIKTRVRRKDSKLISDSPSLNVATYAYPYANSMPDFKIGDNLTIGLYNPLGRTVTVSLLGNDDNQISSETTSGTSITGYNNTVIQDRLYASIPDSQSGIYKVKVTYGNQITEKTGGKYMVDVSICKPLIGDITYKDINSSVTAITENNQLIVQNQSQVQVTAGGLTGQKGAVIQSCYLVVDGFQHHADLNGSSAVSAPFKFSGSGQQMAVCYVMDSRGIVTDKSVKVNVEKWDVPSAIITMQRQDNFYTETDINVDADFASVNGKNAVSITFKGKKEGDIDYSVSGSLENNVKTMIELDNNYSWDVVVTVVDLFGGTAMYNLWLSRGMPIIFFDRLKSSVGINCFPKEERSLEVNGVNVEKSIMTIRLSQHIVNQSEGEYEIIPFNDSISSGSKLNITEDGGIGIGANISKILVSGRIQFQTLGEKGDYHVRITKNFDNWDNAIAWAYSTHEAGNTAIISITPLLAEVNEGDVLYMSCNFPHAGGTVFGLSYCSSTSLTVETVE